MGMYEIERRKYEPKNFFAGDFPIVPESGTAAADIPEFTPVTMDADGKITPIAAAKGSGDTATTSTVGEVIGITAEAAEKDGPVVYYQTGEFFASAINLPEGVTLAELKPALRKLTIFLKD